MKALLRITLCSAAALSTGIFFSCIKEKDCPVSPAVYVEVQDKNYANAAETGQAIDENLPFSQYVGSMNVSYTADGDTDPLTIQSVIPSGNDKRYMLQTGSIPSNLYNISITGRIAATATDPSVDVPLIELHPSQTESDDIYIGTGSGNLPPEADRTIILRRTKGKLNLKLTNLPPSITKIEIRVTGVYKNVDTQLNYSGTTGVNKTFNLASVTDPLPLGMLLAPTDDSGNTSVMIFLYDNTNTPVEIFSNITTTILRNQITSLELRYDPDLDTWELWVMLEGEWQQLHNLDIQ